MKFEIEDGVPIPHSNKSHGKHGRPLKSPVTAALKAMNVSQSFLIDQYEDFIRSRGAFCKYADRKFIARKVPNGWRVWRIE